MKKLFKEGKMIKLKVLKKLGKSVIDIGIQEVDDVNFARQLVEKGLAELIEGEIPPKKQRNKTIEVKEPKKEKKSTPKKKKG